MTRAGASPVPAGRRGAGLHDRGLADFLQARLTDELALLWERDATRHRRPAGPGLAAQVAVIDELLATLRAGLLPHRRDLRILLLGYGTHPDYDPAWTRRLHDGS